MNNGLLQVNPAIGVKVFRKTNGDKAVLPYTVEEARAVLEASSKLTGANRWLQWIMAYSGGITSRVLPKDRMAPFHRITDYPSGTQERLGVFVGEGIGEKVHW